jgi:hypothetical protein
VPSATGRDEASQPEEDPWGEEEVVPDYEVPDRSGLSDTDLEPRPPSRLGKRLRWLNGAQLVVIIFALLLLVPLILAVVLDPLIKFLSRT